jgi:tetratricopeptide (TPR) repeat protein
MSKRDLLRCIPSISIAILAFTANAQIPIEVYQNAKNLKVLSPDISAEELRAKMFSIGQQVGLRCSKCHDFVPGTPFAERDYASDQKELKRVAREMMRMVQGLNDAISAIDRGPDHQAITVQCVTCHRGVSKPRQIEEIFATAINEDGLTSAIELYKELREDRYGTGAYDFSAWRLGGIAQSIFDSGDTEGGMQVHALNLELNRNDGSVYFHRAESYEKQGKIEDAIADFERALERDDSFGFLKDRISRLRMKLEGRE